MMTTKKGGEMSATSDKTELVVQDMDGRGALAVNAAGEIADTGGGTSADLLRIALDKGVDVDQLEKSDVVVPMVEISAQGLYQARYKAEPQMGVILGERIGNSGHQGRGVPEGRLSGGVGKEVVK